MPFSLSPSVQFTETDLTNTIQAVATSVGGLVGQFNWGPAEERISVTSEDQLVTKFGKPDDTNFKDWFTAANFLAYSNNLLVVRAVDANAKNAGDAAAALIKNDADHESTGISTNNFLARYPGALGNNIKVYLSDSTNFADTGFTDYADNFNRAPTGTEMWVVVTYDGTVVEAFETDTTAGTTDYNGNSMYIEDVVNRQSKYIFVDESNLTTTIGTTPLLTDNEFILSGGVDSTAVGDAERQTGFALFANSDEVDVNLVMTGGASQVAAEWVVDNIGEVRRDCLVFVSPQSTDVVNAATPATDIVTTRDAFNASTYAVMDGNYKYQYDKYGDVYRWVPLNGDIAGLCARTDDTNDPWWSPAGFSRGKVKNVVKLAFNPTKADRDELYKNGVNPVVNFPGDGVVLFGDKTMTTAPSAFGYINVRRLFIVIEKAIATVSKTLLFEFNDTFTRNRFINMVEPYLRNIKGRRGIYDFAVVADERVNTPEVIDRGEFVANIYIKPSRTIQNVYLNFVATKTGVVFEELVAG